jgi:hypothetical protein
MSEEQPIDVRDMAIIHRTFRRTFDESARLVRAAPEPSSARVTFLADHIDFAIATMDIHHEGEDELLYPKLIERAPEQAGPGAYSPERMSRHQITSARGNRRSDL